MSLRYYHRKSPQL